MTNELLLRIGEVIDTAFEGEVHVSKSEQGYEAPAFFINEIRQELEQIATLQKKQSTHHIAIKFHAKKVSDDFECLKVGDELKHLLELLDFKEIKVKANNMYFEVRAGTLHFFVDYALQYYLHDEKEKFENIEIQEGVK